MTEKYEYKQGKQSDRRLLDYCRWNETKKAIEILEQNNNLDLMMEDGIHFRLCIKKGNCELLEELLKYYHHTKLNDHDCPEYRANVLCYYKILKDAENIYATTITDDMKNILDKYRTLDSDGIIRLLSI